MLSVGELFPAIGNKLETDEDPEEQQIRVEQLVSIEEEERAMDRM